MGSTPEEQIRSRVVGSFPAVRFTASPADGKCGFSPMIDADAEKPIWMRSKPETRLRSRSEVRAPLRVGFREAQPFVNFCVFTPLRMPKGCAIQSTTLRPEQPPGRPEGITAEDIGQTPWSEANPSSLRTVIGGGGRSLRIKQFLYDWAPPAAAIAPLWDAQELESFECAGGIGWLGPDYRGAQGACVQLHCTQIELSVLDGAFSPSEIRALFSSLELADPGGAALVNQAAFHLLNYWVRYRIQPYRVPHGLWKYPFRRPYDSGEHIREETQIAFGDGTPVLRPGNGETRFNSAFRAGAEIEVYYRFPGHPHLWVWMVCARKDSERMFPLPPEPETQTAAVRERRQFRNRTGWVACLQTPHGAWEALWEEGDLGYAVWTSASPSWDYRWFRAFLESLT